MISPEKKSAPEKVSAEAAQMLQDLRNAAMWFWTIDGSSPDTLNNHTDKLRSYIASLESLLAEQREDAKRLDWLSKFYSLTGNARVEYDWDFAFVASDWENDNEAVALREAIDSARNPAPASSGKAFFGADPIVGEE